MKTENTVKIVSFCLAAAVCFGGFALKARNELKSHQLEIQNGYARALDELNESVDSIHTALKKAEYLNGAKQISLMAAELLTEAETAKNALSRLPKGNSELTVLNKFLSQVGNYAVSVSKELISSNQSVDFSGDFEMLKNTAEKISRAVANSDISYNNPEAWATEMKRTLTSEIDESSLAGVLDGLEESLSDFPTLVYDGPYSDSILSKEPLMIKNSPSVTETQALEVAAVAAETEIHALKNDGTAEGKIPVYRFTGDDIFVTVSRNGGYPVLMRKNREIAETGLDHAHAAEKARKYLESIGFQGFTETYYFTDEGVCVISFAFLDGSTICYTDLVKVGVATDNGEIMLFEASGYLTNHTDRAFNTPEITSDAAMQAVGDHLAVQETALALIPTSSGKEVRCYEFLCAADDGQEVLIYINALTGEQEDVLILLKSDGGTLAK